MRRSSARCTGRPTLDDSVADILVHVKVPPGEMKVVFDTAATEQPIEAWESVAVIR